VLSIENVFQLLQDRPGEKQGPGAEFGHMVAVLPHRSGVGQADDHVVPTDPDHLRKSLQRSFVGQVFQHLKGADHIVTRIRKR
jgi:hypothetical protein